MQALILAAGESSRFFPFNSKHKGLFNILGEPIIVHTIRGIKKSGINDIIIVNGNNEDFQTQLGNGKKYGVKIRYVTQLSPTGMGDAVLLASKYLTSDFFVLHSHRVDFFELKQDLDKKRGANKYVTLLAKEVESIGAFGALITEGDVVKGIVEKPKKGEEPSRLKVIGVYSLNPEFIQTLKSVKSNHYSFEDALDKHAKMGLVRFQHTIKDTVSLKYPWDLLGINEYMFRTLIRKISKKATIAKTAIIEGNVEIGEGSVISDNVVIKGPCYIGKNVFIGTSVLIRTNADLEDDVKIGAYTEVKNSIISQGSTSHSGFFGDSVVGAKTKVGAGFNTANVRLDRKNVKSEVKGEEIDTGLRHLGALIGDRNNIASRVTIMPGIIVGNNVNIGPGTVVMKNISSDTTYYTEFKEIVEKNKPAGK